MKSQLKSVWWTAALLAVTTTVIAQDAVFTYQGRVTANGSNFGGMGQFQFALVTSSNANHAAKATANAPSGGFVTGYNVVSGGNGYVSAPAVTIFGGGGSGAAAHANISGGVVTSLSVDSPGNGQYTSAPTVIIAPPPPNVSYVTYWSNDGTSVAGSEPAGAVSVPVSNGLFTVMLGDTTLPKMVAISASLFAQPNLQLRIWFNDGENGFSALDPAQALTPAPYALVAQNLNSGLLIQHNTNGAPNVIGGSSLNFVSNGNVGATIAGGGAIAYHGFAYSNSVTADFGTVGGGIQNTASGYTASVAGGYFNAAEGTGDTVAGGWQNTANGQGGAATVGGGWVNSATAGWATVSGGQNNTASGKYATVAGGSGNTASGQNSFAAGFGAQALHDFSFVWNGAGSGGFASTAAGQFAVHATGGIRLAGDVQLDSSTYHNLSLSGGNAIGYLYGSYPALGDGIHLGYNYYWDSSGAGHIINTGGGTSRLTVGYGFVGIYVGDVDAHPTTQRLLANTAGVTVNGTFNNNSDRNAKRDFAPVSPSQILDKVLRLPVTEWSYKEDPQTRHVGPMAQDFYSIFSLGTDDKHIAPIDEGGVALAAIQGLNQKLKEKEAEIADLKARLEKLEQMSSKQESE